MTTTETNVQPGAMIRATSLPSSNKTLKINDILLVCRAHEEKVDANYTTAEHRQPVMHPR